MAFCVASREADLLRNDVVGASELELGNCRRTSGRSLRGILPSRPLSESLHGISCGFKAFNWCSEDSSSDLTAILARETPVDDRRYTRAEHTFQVDSSRSTAETEVWNFVLRMLPDGDVVHSEVHDRHLLRRASLIRLQTKCSRLGETAKSDTFSDVAFAAHPLDVVRCEAFEQSRLDHGMRSCEPPIPQAAHSNGETLTTSGSLLK